MAEMDGERTGHGDELMNVQLDDGQVGVFTRPDANDGERLPEASQMSSQPNNLFATQKKVKRRRYTASPPSPRSITEPPCFPSKRGCIS